MEPGPDVTRIVRSWLRTDEHESADRVLGIVLAQLDTTPQRRSWWPAWRIADMNTFAKFAIAAVAVVAVALVGINLLPDSGRGGGVGASPSPSPSPTPSPSAQPSPSPSAALAFPPPGPLETGRRYSMILENVPFTFAVPKPGWTSNGVFAVDKKTGVDADNAGFIFWDDAPVGVFADPCAGVEGPDLGTSMDGLAAAVAELPGTDLVSGPESLTVGGKPARNVVITVREDVGCAAEQFEMWWAPGPDMARYATALGSTYRVWIVDVDGAIVWIDGETFKGAGPGPNTELQQIVESIKFE
jgi:hypothetical protein